MFRSILKGSFLAASLCVLAMSSNAHARSHLSSSGDVNLIETSAGQEYAAHKKSGATCPFAKKGNRDDVTVLASAGGAAASVGGFSSSRTTVH
jgi:phosphoribosylcarboxyaminoimidazole (NCAIR) mutase